MAALLGLVMGGLAIRRSGIYFAMITLALAQMVFFFFLQAPFTGGEDGLQRIPRGTALGFIDLSKDINLYYLVMIVFAVGYFIIWRTVHSPFGAGAQGPARERAARGVAGLRRGALQAAGLRDLGRAGRAGRRHQGAGVRLRHAVGRHLADVECLIILMTLIGGLGTLTGPILGAFIVVLLENKVGDFGRALTN